MLSLVPTLKFHMRDKLYKLRIRSNLSRRVGFFSYASYMHVLPRKSYKYVHEPLLHFYIFPVICVRLVSSTSTVSCHFGLAA